MPHDLGMHERIIAKLQTLDYRNSGPFVSLRVHLTLVTILSAALLMVGVHTLIWVAVLQVSGKTWPQLLQHWDAGWYLKIIQQGYNAASSAFPPLFPFSVEALTKLLGLTGAEATLWVGRSFSFLCFAVALVLLRGNVRVLRMESLRWGALLFLLFSPASYVLHTFHTEALFFLLSLLGFIALHKKNWWMAAIWAGLAALTRHQGVLLAIALAFGSSLTVRGLRSKMLVFGASGCISALIWGLAPLYHYLEGRGWFPAMSAHQSHWFVADSIQTYFKTFLLANPIQNYRFGSLIHHLFYFIWLGGTFLLLRKGHFAEALYCLLSLAIMPLQGELVDAFRFGAVLFPVLIILGNYWERSPRWIAWPFMGLYLALNLVVAYQYGIHRWAY